MDYCIFSRRVKVPCPKNTCCTTMGAQCCVSCRNRHTCKDRCPQLQEKMSDTHRAKQ